MNVFKVNKIQGHSLGDKFMSSRVKKKLEFLDIYRMSGIEIKYLKALEQEDWDAFPGEIYLKNFLKKYCQCLGLNQKLCLSQYNKQKSLVSRKKLHDKKIKNSFFKKVSDYITPKRLTLVLLTMVVIIFMSYIMYGVASYIKPPKIEIFYPEKEYTTVEDSININGKTEPESILSINNEAVGVSDTGDFSVDVKLKAGLNKFELVSQKKHSMKNYKEIIVYQKINL